MKHVTQIRQMITEGQLQEAQDALDVLLEFGPSNVDALKIKAILCAHEGRFVEEEAYWLQILGVDREDRDAIHFFLKKQLHERERQYFTDVLPDGSRRFLGYPRALIKMAMYGLLGCVGFLSLMNYVESTASVAFPPWAVFTSFAFMVVLPWIGIINIYFRSVKSILIDRDGIAIHTRLKSLRYRWDELDKIALTHSTDPWMPSLKLVLVPKAQGQAVAIDLNDESSAIRAKSDLVSEIKMCFQNFTYEPYDNLRLGDWKVSQF